MANSDEQDLGFVKDDGVGFTPATSTNLTPDQIENQQYDSLQEKYGTLPQQLLTGLEAAGKGFAGPLAAGVEKLLTKAGVPGLSPEEQTQRAAANPTIAGGGELGGLGVGMLTGTGEAAVMEGIGHALAPGAGIASAAARAAAENAVYQIGDETSKMINEDPKQTIGSAIADVGLSAALGGVAGGALGGASALWSKTAGTKVGQGISDFVGRFSDRINNPDPAAALYKELQDFHDSISAGTDDIYGHSGIRAQAIKAGMPEMSDKITSAVNSTNDILEGTLKKLKNDPNVGLLQEAAQKFQEQVTKPGAGSAEIFDATNELKQQLQEWGKFNKLAPPPLAERNFINTVKSVAYDLRNSLEDSDVWGKAGEVQKTINQAFAGTDTKVGFFDALKDFRAKFMEKIGGDYEISPGKVATYENQLGKASGQTKQTMLKNFMDAAGEYRQAAESAYADAGIESPFKNTPTNLINQSMEKVTGGAKVADAVVDKLASKLGGGAIGGAIGSMFGHGWLGALVGEHALPSFLKSAMPALLKPFVEKDASAVGAKSAVDLLAATIRGQNLAGKSVKSLFDASVPVSSKLFVDQAQRDKLSKQVAEYQTNPSKYANIGGDVGHYLPDHDMALKEAASNAIGYLQSIKPSTQKLAPLDPEIKPTEYQMAQYNRALDIAQQPLTVLKLAKEGKLTPQDMTHVNSMYPDFHSGVNQKIMNEMIAHVSKDKAIPYGMRQSLSMLMGQPLDSSLSQAGIASNQAAIAMSRQQSQAQNAPMKPVKNKGSMKEMKIADRTSLHQESEA